MRGVLIPYVICRLRTLEVQGNSLESADGLGQGCSSLERVLLYRNKLASLDGLGGMEHLNYIDAGRNELVDAAGLPDSRLLEVSTHEKNSASSNSTLTTPLKMIACVLAMIPCHARQSSALSTFKTVVSFPVVISCCYRHKPTLPTLNTPSCLRRF
jgi:hypothetical protein